MLFSLTPVPLALADPDHPTGHQGRTSPSVSETLGLVLVALLASALACVSLRTRSGTRDRLCASDGRASAWSRHHDRGARGCHDRVEPRGCFGWVSVATTESNTPAECSAASLETLSHVSVAYSRVLEGMLAERRDLQGFGPNQWVHWTSTLACVDRRSCRLHSTELRRIVARTVRCPRAGAIRLPASR